MAPVIVDFLLLHCLKNRSVHCQGCIIIITMKNKKEKRIILNIISLSSSVLLLPFNFSPPLT